MSEQNTPVTLLEELYYSWSKKRAIAIEPLPESGSYRQYFRIKGEEQTVMGVYNTDNRENNAFVYLDRHLMKTGNSVPEIFSEDIEHNVYLEQDLGDVTLLDYLEKIKDSMDRDEKTRTIYRKIVEAMPSLQVHSTQDLDYSVCYPRSEFDVQSMM
jgi:aminoglycoside/choline kinase family phosphotransferase